MQKFNVIFNGRMEHLQRQPLKLVKEFVPTRYEALKKTVSIHTFLRLIYTKFAKIMSNYSFKKIRQRLSKQQSPKISYRRSLSATLARTITRPLSVILLPSLILTTSVLPGRIPRLDNWSQLAYTLLYSHDGLCTLSAWHFKNLSLNIVNMSSSCVPKKAGRRNRLKQPAH